jgi:signal transduction histidine kinase
MRVVRLRSVPGLGGAVKRKSTHAPVQRPLSVAELQAAEREKVRLSIELHDGLGQHLTGIAFLAKALANRLRAAESNQTTDAEQIVGLTNQAINTIRALARGLRPVGPEDNALWVALAQLSKDISKVYGIDCLFIADEPVLIVNSKVSHHLYRIAQEAVHNAVKHGQPGRIKVDLSNRAVGVTLRVTNPGKLDEALATPVAQRDGLGIGITSMRYRAGLIGAKMSLETRRQREVCLRVVVPHEIVQRPEEMGDMHD